VAFEKPRLAPQGQGAYGLLEQRTENSGQTAGRRRLIMRMLLLMLVLALESYSAALGIKIWNRSRS